MRARLQDHERARMFALCGTTPRPSLKPEPGPHDMTSKRKASPAKSGTRATPAPRAADAPPSDTAETSSEEDEFMSIEAACGLLGKWRASVHNLMLEGELKWRRIAGRRLLYRASVEAYKRKLDAAKAATP